MRVGFVGWRGMVGSVLLERMRAERDFDGIEPVFFSTSNAGGEGPPEACGAPLGDANDLHALRTCDVLISAQGGDYTKAVHGPLRASGYRGLWIDAASTLRMSDASALVLDPVNGTALRDALAAGTLNYIGSNCTVSLMLMGMVGLLRTQEVRWIQSMTYQAASGAGAAAMTELVAQMRHIARAASPVLDAGAQALELERVVHDSLHDAPQAQFGAPLAASAIPWIDSAMPNGQTREEWKATAEASKLLGAPTAIDGLCVRIGALRCHAQGLTIQLKRPVPLEDIEAAISQAHPWVDLVPNTKADSLASLTPAATAGSLRVPVGRLRVSTVSPDVVTAFTVGDQLLWGAAEPLRRMLLLVREHRE
jgi:aspartate-semialdehyde dehydrogenase